MNRLYRRIEIVIDSNLAMERIERGTSLKNYIPSLTIMMVVSIRDYIYKSASDSKNPDLRQGRLGFLKPFNTGLVFLGPLRIICLYSVYTAIAAPIDIYIHGHSCPHRCAHTPIYGLYIRVYIMFYDRLYRR